LEQKSLKLAELQQDFESYRILSLLGPVGVKKLEGLKKIFFETPLRTFVPPTVGSSHFLYPPQGRM
jgi:hypothetical protein